MADELAKKVVQGYDALKTERGAFDERLRDITRYCLPEWENQNEDTRNDNAPARPVSSAPVNASIMLGGHLYSHTIATGQRWFSLRTALGDEQNADASLKEWLQEAADTALKKIQNSNFNEAFGSMVTLYATYGTGIISAQYDPRESELVFRNHSVNGNIYLAEDEVGRVNTVYRLLRYTAQQAAQVYGAESLPDEVRKALGDPAQVTTKFDFIQMVAPNPNYDWSRPDNQAMPYRSVEVYKQTETVVAEDGFRTFPFACPRFIKLRDFAYGYGAGHQALPAIRELNRTEALYISAAEMAAGPPTFTNDEELMEIERLEPFGVYYVDPANGPPQQFQMGPVPQTLFERVQQLQGEIQELFYVNVFLAISQKYRQTKTATEVEELTEEKLNSIGPMVSRLQSECFSPLVERVISLLMQHGELPPPPPTLLQQGFRVVYTSRIDSKFAEVKALQELRAQEMAARMLAQGAQLPELGDVHEYKRAAAKLLESMHVDQDHIVSDQERKKREQARAQAEQAMQQAQQVDPIDPQKAAEPGSPLDQATRTPMPL